MRILYVDAFSGISGDMTVGALLDLGLPLDLLREQLARLPLPGVEVLAEEQLVYGIKAIKIQVLGADGGRHRQRYTRQRRHARTTRESHEHGHRSFREIRSMIAESDLGSGVKERALAIFSRLAEAEGKVHGVMPDNVEFHEVGAIDSIADIVGTAVGLDYFAPDRVLVSPLPLGSGRVNSRHGPIPVPGPATAELLRGFVTRPGDGEGEMVTPTGAAIIAACAAQEPLPALRIGRIGYGAGQRRLGDRPNVLRLILGQMPGALAVEDLTVVETNIDDYNPELYDYAVERLFEAGARDVFLTPVQMKKGRPGILVSVLCKAADRDAIASLLFAETSSIGVRYYPVERLVLEREVRTVETAYGTVRVKVARSPSGHDNVAPEYEDCKRIAAQKKVPIKLVYRAALAAAAV